MNKAFRLTKQKKIVLDEVLSRCDHPTAEQIYLSIHEKFPNISKSTVYRNLDVLSQEGLLNRIVHKEGDRFDLTLNNHYHVYCKICHKLVDTRIPYNKDFDKKVAAETSFLIDKHSLVFEGICPECQEKMKGKINE